jgi:hypothetical protein
MVKVKGSSIGAARAAIGMSEVALARHVRQATGDPRNVDAVRAYLRRVERSEGDVELEPEQAAAIAAALGVSVDDLTDQLLWVLGLDGGVYTLGEHVLAWSSAAEAMRWRYTLALLGAPRAPEIEVTSATRRALLSSGGEYLALAVVDQELAAEAVLIDRSEETIRAAVLLEQLLMGLRPPESVLQHIASLGLSFNLERVRLRLTIRLELAIADGREETVQSLRAQLRNLSRVVRAVDRAAMAHLRVLGVDDDAPGA